MKPTVLIISVALLVIISCAKQTDRTPERLGENNIAYQWGKIALECTARDTELFRPRPTVTSRMLALVWISVFDAWSRYDAVALPVYATHISRRPVEEHVA